jgi:hypothetical protein
LVEVAGPGLPKAAFLMLCYLWRSNYAQMQELWQEGELEFRPQEPFVASELESFEFVSF